MKAIMISIRPEWVEKILNGKKTIEIRKTAPKCEFPVKCYIYCTKSKPNLCDRRNADIKLADFEFVNNLDSDDILLNGKVVAEFILNKVTKHEKNYIDIEDNLCYNFSSEDVKKAGFYLSDKNAISTIDTLCEFDLFVERYGRGKPLYAWHIDSLKVYDKPKKLSEFFVFIPNNECNGDCPKCGAYSKEYDACLARKNLCKTLRKTPQPWCYVKESENGKLN